MDRMDNEQPISTSTAVLEAKMSALALSLQQAEAVCALTAGTVHDVGNALQVIQCEAELLLLKLHTQDEIDAINTVLLAAKHAHEIIRGLSALARKGESGATLVDTNKLIATCSPLIERVVQKRATCAYLVEAEIWPVLVQAQQLEAALINLAANARDAMPPSGGAIRITARNVPTALAPSTLPAGDYVVFSIEDTGTGMTAEVLQRATEAFFTTKSAGAGSGLGLSMVQSFAVRCGGGLRIDSDPTRGTTVEIFLPRAPASAPPRQEQLTTKHEVVARIREHIRTEWLRDVLDAWVHNCGAGFPRPAQVQSALLGHLDDTVVVAVEGTRGAPALRLVHLGDELVRALEHAQLHGLPESHPMLSEAGAYQRVLRTGVPSFESARYSFGDDSPFTFERLIMPAGAGGETPSHLIGAVALVMVRQPEQI